MWLTAGNGKRETGSVSVSQTTIPDSRFPIPEGL